MKAEVKDYKKISDNQIMEVNISNHSILLGRFEGSYYALSGKCTHLGCKLAKGEFNKGVITCPCHGSQFSIVDGSVVKWIEDWPMFFNKLTKTIGLDKPLKTYNLELERDKLYIII